MLNASRVSIGAMMVVVFSVGAWAAPVVVDDFEDGLANLIVDDGYDFSTSDSDTQAGLDASAVIGGQRDASLAFVSGVEYARVRINRRDSGVFSFAEDTDTKANATLSYGLGGDLEADLTDGASNNAFLLVFNTADLVGQVTIAITTTETGGSSTWMGPTPSGIYNVDTDFLVAFTDPGWVDVAGGADLTDVDTIAITFTGVENGDYIVNEITTVPEPGAATILALGTMLLIRRRRRRRE